ncbi:helix-turn-helix transcriptional regulator [bacterium]|nr:helix-turn-helix transcriptional regulator [bacterium]MBU1064405.1 helix-turn-helix transcriptional regulator [bacterium]MBU1633660.1 helix-turn-helix transcriptional regulator [bacterium]
MSDLNKYIDSRKSKDIEFSENFDAGYENFKIGILLKQMREKAGYTQEELAIKLDTKKSAISRIENHAEDIRLSTLEKYARVLGMKLQISIANN